MVRRICEITDTLDFIFRLVLCSHEDVSFNSKCLNVLEGINQFYLIMWFKKNRLETPFKGDSVKALIKTFAFGSSVIFLNDNFCQMIGACIFMTANEFRNLMWMGSPIQNNC